MADIHPFKSHPSPADIEMLSLTISSVSGSLGLLAMIASRVDDDEMVVSPRDFKGMMDTLQDELSRAYRRLQAFARSTSTKEQRPASKLGGGAFSFTSEDGLKGILVVRQGRFRNR